MKPSLKAALVALLCGVLACPIALPIARAGETTPVSDDDDAWADDIWGSPQKDVDDATKAINAGGDRDTLVEAYNKRADAERELHDLAEACADYGKVIELKKQARARDSGVESYTRAQIELTLDQPISAMSDFNAALASQNDWSDALLGRAQAYFLEGDLTRALADAKKAKEFLKPAYKAEWKEPVFDADLAVANKAVFDKPGDAKALRARGVLRFRSGTTHKANSSQLFQSALKDFYAANQLDLTAPAPFLDLALAKIVLNSGQQSLFANSKRAEILKDFDDAIAADAKFTPALAAKAIYLLSTPIQPGIAFIGQSSDKAAVEKQNLQAREDAISLLNQAAKIEPSVAQWPNLLAIAERSQPAPDAKKLIELYTRAATLTPSTLPPELNYVWPTIFTAAQGNDFKAEMLSQRAQIYMAIADADHALTDLNAALKLQDHVAWHLLRARLYTKKKNWDGVISDVNFALGDGMIDDNLPDLSEVMSVSDAEHADALLLRASAYDEKGNFTQAQIDVNAALKIDPARAAVLKGTRYDPAKTAAN